MDPRDAPLVLGLTATIIKGSAKKKEDFYGKFFGFAHLLVGHKCCSCKG